MKFHHTVSAMLALAAFSAASSTIAFAQVQQVPQGRVLDANPQVGSGGANRPVPGYQPINGNDIVTGNVAGLKYFHGNVPYRSTYDFGSGNSALSPSARFDRVAAGDGPGAYSSGVSSTYYSAVSTVSRGQYGFQPGAIGGGYEARYIPRQAISPTAPGTYYTGSGLNAGVPMRSFDRLDATGTSRLEIPSDRAGGALSSPLYGLRTDVITESRSIDGSTRNNSANPGTEGVTDPATESNIPRNPNALSESARITGQIPDTALATSFLKPKDEMIVSDAYKSLMGELKKAEDEAAQKAGLTPAGVTPVPAAPGGNTNTDDPSLASNNAANPRNKPRVIVDPLTGTAQLTRDGTSGTPVQSDNPAAPNYIPKAELDRLEAEARNRLTSGSQVKPLESLAGAAAGTTSTTEALPRKFTPFDEVMTKAEKLLNQQKYFEAADEFQAALLLQPANPLAIVGRAHAELGAGLYESAAWDLKYLFTRKPEMMAVRYDLTNFLPVRRQEALLADLLKLSVKKDAGNTASFLYCYLCYQTGRQTAMKEELDRWSNREWADGWQKAMVRAWIK